MATRRRSSWKLDNQGRYPKQIGWKLSASGKRTQHKFRPVLTSGTPNAVRPACGLSGM